jgi:hypothetical protein
MYKIETERGDLFDVNMMIAMQVNVRGNATETELTEAFRVAVGAFEILNCKVVIDDKGIAFYEKCTLPMNSIVFRDFELEELIQEQERIRFRLEDGEFLRCFVSFSNKEEMKICFLMHHLGGDGKSLCYFIEAFMKSLSGEKCEYRRIQILNKGTLPKTSKLSFLASLVTKVYNRKWKKQRRTFNFEDMEAAYEKFWKSHKTTVKNVVTEGEKLSRKLCECKANKIGFTSYTIAKMIKDIPQVQDIGLAVDGRQDSNRTMSNQATGIAVKYRYDKRKTLTENAAVIDREMKKKLRDENYKYLVLRFMSAFEPTLVDAVNLEFAGHFHSRTTERLAKILGYGQNTKDISITNLTRLDIPTEYGAYRLTDFIFVPPVVSYGKNIIGMITIGDRLNTTYHRYQDG